MLVAIITFVASEWEVAEQVLRTNKKWTLLKAI